MKSKQKTYLTIPAFHLPKKNKNLKDNCKDPVCGPSLNIGYVGPISPEQ